MRSNFSHKLQCGSASPWAIAVACSIALATAMGIGRFAFTPLLPMMLAEGALDGNAWAMEPTLHQSASLRPPNRDKRIRGLYRVGGGTHPGAGIPGVLLGSEVTAGLVAEDFGRGAGTHGKAQPARA